MNWFSISLKPFYRSVIYNSQSWYKGFDSLYWYKFYWIKYDANDIESIVALKKQIIEIAQQHFV